jgi:hypothetical protein
MRVPSPPETGFASGILSALLLTVYSAGQRTNGFPRTKKSAGDPILSAGKKRAPSAPL